MIKDILEVCKINHYIKNFLILFPLILNLKSVNWQIISDVFFVFFAFCFISSAVYILNDISDIKEDRLHPIKCTRPIANGRISKKLGIVILIFLVFLSVIFSAQVNLFCVFCILGYFILNIFYSLFLKNIVVVDVFSIALGFIFRILAGFAALNIKPAFWIIVLTFFFSGFFVCLKRKLELQYFYKSDKGRKTLQKYTMPLINTLIIICAIFSLIFYLFCMTDKIYSAIPFMAIILRMFYLVSKENSDNIMCLIRRDKILIALIILYFIVLIRN